MYSQEDTIANQIKDLKTKYYNKNGTSILFKNTQKRDCAAEIVNNIPINTLLNETIFVVENTNQIYIKYELLKSFAAPSIYSIIINHISNRVEWCIANHGSFQLYINMNTFTITAANRYKELIQMFCEKALQSDSVYHTKLQAIYLYNYPAIIPVLTQLFSAFVDSSARGKVVMVK